MGARKERRWIRKRAGRNITLQRADGSMRATRATRPRERLAGARGYCAYDIEARLGVSVALPADDRLRSRGPLVDPLSRALHRPLELAPLEPVHRSTRHRTRVR